MKRADIITLYDYNYWANQALLTAAAKVSPEQFVAPGSFPWGSLRGTLVHTMDAEIGWRSLFEQGRWTEDLSQDEFPSVESLEQRWHEEEKSMRAYLAGLDDEDLEGILRYTIPEGLKRERVLWHCLFHVVNHGTQHRSEAAALLTEFGQSPGDVDFTYFLIVNK